MKKERSWSWPKPSWVAVGVVAVVLFVSLFTFRELVFPAQYRTLVIEEARRQGVDHILVAAIILRETRFAPQKISREGDRGLMQIQPATLEELVRVRRIPSETYSKQDLLRPDINVGIGVRYIKYLQERIVRSQARQAKLKEWFDGDSTVVLLHCYNAGPTFTLRDALDVANVSEEYEAIIANKRPSTAQYSQDVLSYYRILKVIDFLFPYKTCGRPVNRVPGPQLTGRA